MNELTLVVGSKNYSSWSLRPYLALAHTGQPFREVVIPLDQPDTARLISQHSPAGRVPVLHDGALVIWDSSRPLCPCPMPMTLPVRPAAVRQQ